MTPEAQARHILGECSCHRMYITRGRLDPECAWHSFREEVAEAIHSAELRGARMALEAAARIFFPPEHWMRADEIFNTLTSLTSDERLAALLAVSRERKQ